MTAVSSRRSAAVRAPCHQLRTVPHNCTDITSISSTVPGLQPVLNLWGKQATAGSSSGPSQPLPGTKDTESLHAALGCCLRGSRHGGAAPRCPEASAAQRHASCLPPRTGARQQLQPRQRGHLRPGTCVWYCQTWAGLRQRPRQPRAQAPRQDFPRARPWAADNELSGSWRRRCRRPSPARGSQDLQEDQTGNSAEKEEKFVRD